MNINAFVKHSKPDSKPTPLQKKRGYSKRPKIKNKPIFKPIENYLFQCFTTFWIK
jgi:hypothetical protein